MIGDIGISGPPDLRWIRPNVSVITYKSVENIVENRCLMYFHVLRKLSDKIYP